MRSDDEDKLNSRHITIDEAPAFAPECPERELLRAILKATLSDLGGTGAASRRARFYLTNDDEEYCLSFVNICALLELDPGYIRRLAGLPSTAAPRVRPAARAVRRWYPAD
jgi:hypothetical protein